jgi:hypothetical protein
MSRTIEHCGKRDDAQQNPEGQKYIHGDQQPPVCAHLFMTLKAPMLPAALGLCGNAKGYAARIWFERVQPGAMLFLHWLCQNNSASETGELPKLVLDCL